MEHEIYIGNLGIASEVITTIVQIAALNHDGVESVGENILTNQAKKLFNQSPANAGGVEVAVVDDKLMLSIRLSVFYGYNLKTLAQEVRLLIADAIKAQLNVEVSAIDVFIDHIVIPKN
ncbi:MAG: Asp23/Gls24 family envelope stress response protein [Coriobacteriia bacterium]|nr:Asp23/Gls24 family envelope stress response protein [Coriobacteriia bacterium]